MAEVGLMPGDPAEAMALELLDRYGLRANGLDRALPLTQFGRALFYLSRRSGFKSNRKTDRCDNESGKIKGAAARLAKTIDFHSAEIWSCHVGPKPMYPFWDKQKTGTIPTSPLSVVSVGQRRHCEMGAGIVMRQEGHKAYSPVVVDEFN